MARPSKILSTISLKDPETGETEETPITEAICRYVTLGAWPGNAAQACGITRQTLHNWVSRGEEWSGGDEEVPEEHRVYVEFFDALTRAEARGLMWHEMNVRNAAQSSREQGGRLSLEFLSRRLRNVYGREVRVEHGGKITHEVEAEVDERIEGILASLGSSGEAAPAGATAD